MFAAFRGSVTRATLGFSGGFHVVDDAPVAEATAEEVPLPAEAAERIEEYIPGPAELAVIDAGDRHEAMVRMDEHDVRMLLERVQSSALRKWVYVLPDGSKGLTVHAVQDITQTMNWSGKCRIGVLPETLTVEQITADAGNGPEPFWVATIFAKDNVTEAVLPGSSMEPQRMRLRQSTADRKRKAGAKIPDDNAIFDVFSRTKAIQKATRNALAAFIPEQVEQTIIAMFEKDPSRVEKIQTEAEARVAELPPPLTDDKAKALVAEARLIDDRIRELGGGQGKVLLTPGMFHAYLANAEHSHERLEDFLGYLRDREEKITAQFEEATA
jgi:hypothetical protein